MQWQSVPDRGTKVRKQNHLLFCTYRVDFEKAGLGKQLAEDKDDDTASVISEL